MDRTFLILRYSTSNWPQLMGQRPFIATGPNFRDWVVPGSLDRFREYRFSSKLREACSSLGDVPTDLVRESLAELLLREGILVALWNVTSPSCLVPECRWQESIMAVAEEIHDEAPVSHWAIELLAGMSDPSHFHSYVSADAQVLEIGSVPPE